MVLSRSLTARIVALMSVLTVVSIAAVMMVSTVLYEATLTRRALDARAGDSVTLASQMAPGVKWRKPEAIERVYAPFAAAETGTDLSDMVVLTADGTPLVSFRADHHANFAVSGPAQRAASLTADRPVAQVEAPAHDVFVVRIDDPKKGEPVGYAIFAWSQQTIQAEMAGIERTAAAIGIVAALVSIAAVVALLQVQVSRPLRALRASMERLAAGDLQAEVPFRRRSDEIGAMAKTVEVFRENAVDMDAMSRQKADAERAAVLERLAARARKEEQDAERLLQEEAARASARRREEEEHNRERERERQDAERREAQRHDAEQERRRMMSRLRDAFGELVDAAVEGDFSRRVECGFDDEALDQLAAGLNRMAETVASGLDETRRVLGAVANYDLSRRVAGQYSGDFAELGEGVNRTADNLARIVSQLTTATAALQGRARTLSKGFVDLSRRTADQAASVEETTAATTVLNASVQHAAVRAATARERVTAVRAAATESGEIMASATGAMDRVVRSSDEIAAIVEIIEGIAFQTNLLSLNASVEAARAGDAGIGFAVVASEVRTLAQSAAESSGEIRALIDRSRAEVRRGVDSVGKAAATLHSIVESVTEVDELMSEISDDATEQSAQLREISNAVSQFDSVTQHNAQLVESATGILDETVRGVAQIERITAAFVIAPGGPGRRAA